MLKKLIISVEADLKDMHHFNVCTPEIGERIVAIENSLTKLKYELQAEQEAPTQTPQGQIDVDALMLTNSMLSEQTAMFQKQLFLVSSFIVDGVPQGQLLLDKLQETQSRLSYAKIVLQEMVDKQFIDLTEWTDVARLLTEE